MQVNHSFHMSSAFTITHVNMWIYQSSSSGVLDPLWPLHKPKSLINAPPQSFLHENKKLLKQTCLQRLSVQWWSHRGTRRRPSLQRWTPVILRSPPNAPDYQTPQTLWTIGQKSQNKHNLDNEQLKIHCVETISWQEAVPAATSLISQTLKPSFCPPKA